MSAALGAADAARRPPSPTWGRWGLRAVACGYVVVLVIVPLAVIAQDGLSGGVVGLWESVTGPVAWHALRLTLWTALSMVIINSVMGTLTAYVLVRYEFPAKRVLNAVVDLPLAIPTLVTGVMLVMLYGPQGSLGQWLQADLGVRIIFAPPGIILALAFITFPFVVRSVQPVLTDMDRAPEDAAATLGAGPLATFRHVTLPSLALPLTGGALLSFARAVGEFGAIVIVAGNIPLHSQTAAVYVLGEVESENRAGASAMSLVLIAMALVLTLIVDALHARVEESEE